MTIINITEEETELMRIKASTIQELCYLTLINGNQVLTKQEEDDQKTKWFYGSDNKLLCEVIKGDLTIFYFNDTCYQFNDPKNYVGRELEFTYKLQILENSIKECKTVKELKELLDSLVNKQELFNYLVCNNRNMLSIHFNKSVECYHIGCEIEDDKVLSYGNRFERNW